MEDLKMERFGITLSIRWEGKSLHLAVSLEDAIGDLARGSGECDSWQAIHLLKTAESFNAELVRLYTEKTRLFIALNFRYKEELEEFMESLQTTPK